jgi:endonuclease/exonuclease/phosphatase family metal-dependent hydrolase
MRIATWNIYWLGDRTGEKIIRSETDYELIARVVRHLAPDVLALEEIVDPSEMEKILELANVDGGDYIIRSGETTWLTSDSTPEDPSSALQKVFVCINNKTTEFVKGAAIRGGPTGRRPYALKLRQRSSGKECIAVGVHLRSGFPAFLDPDDAAVRLKETDALSRWLQGATIAENPAYPKPDLDDVFVLGDFNAEIDDPNDSLAPLSTGSMAGWLWNKPEPDGDHWETALYAGDRLVIDFIMFSESLRHKVTSGPRIYAWDHDPEMGGSTEFHSGPNGSGDLKGYGVSDHRPVFADLEL